MTDRSDAQSDLLAQAARWVVDEGLEYAPAKRRAAQDLHRHGGARVPLPEDEALEEAVREHIATFCAATQAHEVRALRHLARPWMQRLAVHRPHLAGAVWRGTATRLSAIHIDLYCDDPKSAEIDLLNTGVDFDTQTRTPRRGEPVSVLSVAERCDALGGAWMTLHFSVWDWDDLRGALKPDARGRTWRGDLTALQRLLAPPAAGVASETPAT